MKRNKIAEYQRDKIKSQQGIIDSLRKELEESKTTIHTLESQIDTYKESFAILKAEHDVILQQYQDGLRKMKTIIGNSNDALFEARLAKKDYENEIGVLLKRLRKHI